MPNNITTANGNAIDMEALRLKNEKTVAVGNMRVNARGDELSPTTGEVTRTKNERMTDYYKLHSLVPTEKPRRRGKNTPAPAAQTPAPRVTTTVTVDNNKE
jgi:hypothetical protein